MTPAAQLALHLRHAGIEYVAEHRFHPVRRWRFDFAILPILLAVEVEGGGFVGGRHGRGAGLRSDCEKYAEAMMMGWRVLRVVPDQVSSGKAIAWVEAIHRQLARGGAVEVK